MFGIVNKIYRFEMIVQLKPKYNHMSMGLMNNCMDTINSCRDEIKSLKGRIRPLIIAGKSLIAGLKLLAYGIAFVAALAFEKLTESSKKKSFQQKLNFQIEGDISSFQGKPQELDGIRKEIDDFISHEELFKNKDPATIAKYKRKALSIYCSSIQQYAPVVVEWVHSCLETAKSSNPPKRVVFLARDGIAPFEVAKILKEKYPEKYGDVPISLLYISRTVKDWMMSNPKNHEMFVEYAKQEGIEHDQKCLFIDIGFTGSMIEPIRELLKKVTTDIQFGYLVSHTQNAHGFMANMEAKLESVKAAGQNPAVHWLEDTHQGVVNSPSKLFRDTDGTIRPYFKNTAGHNTCKVHSPKSYLYKHFGMRAILDGAKKIKVVTRYIIDQTYKPQQWNMATQKSKEVFDRFLMQYFKGERCSLAKHF